MFLPRIVRQLNWRNSTVYSARFLNSSTSDAKSGDEVSLADASKEPQIIDPKQVYSEITSELQNKGYNVIARANQVPEVVQFFLDEVKDADFVKRAFVTHPDLLTISPARIKPKFQLLMEIGVNPDASLVTLARCQQIIDRPTEEIYDLCHIMHFLGFNNMDISYMVKTKPQIFAELTDQKMKHFHENIRNMFSRKEATVLMTRTPEICFDNFEDFERKFEYLYAFMGYESKDMILSKRWAIKDLFEIRCRHECLMRTGNYERPHIKKPDIKAANPRIGQIFDTPPAVFAKICFITLEEYDVFTRMYARQLDHELSPPATQNFGDDDVNIDTDFTDFEDYSDDEMSDSDPDIQPHHEKTFVEQFRKEKGYYPRN